MCNLHMHVSKSKQLFEREMCHQANWGLFSPWVYNWREFFLCFFLNFLVSLERTVMAPTSRSQAYFLKSKVKGVKKPKNWGNFWPSQKLMIKVIKGGRQLRYSVIKSKAVGLFRKLLCHPLSKRGWPLKKAKLRWLYESRCCSALINSKYNSIQFKISFDSSDFIWLPVVWKMIKLKSLFKLLLTVIIGHKIET